MTQQWHPHSTVATICERDGLFLMVRENIHGKMVFNQPAGHIEDNESIIQASHRETLEETGCIVKANYLTGIYRFRVSATLTFLRFSIVSDFVQQTEQSIDTDIDSVHWLSYTELVKLKDELRSPLVLQTIEDYRKGTTYPLSLIDNNC